MSRDEKIQEWIGRNLCLGEDKDTFFRAALLYELDRIADDLDDLERIADNLGLCLDWEEGVKVHGRIDTFEQN